MFCMNNSCIKNILDSLQEKGITVIDSTEKVVFSTEDCCMPKCGLKSLILDIFS